MEMEMNFMLYKPKNSNIKQEKERQTYTKENFPGMLGHL